MLPLKQLVADNQELCQQLHRFARTKATRLIASLAVLPDYHANTIRLEVLTHLAVIACSRDIEPGRDDLAKWLHYFDEESWISRQEDPVEDVFVGSVSLNAGTFRLFSGIFSDGYFIAERLLIFLENGASFPTFQETLEIALALLRLSDALAQRLGLKRNTAGGGHSAQNITAPKWRDIKPAFDALFFSDHDLEALGISPDLLKHFCFTDEHLDKLTSERLWNSSLERHPLFRVDGGVIIAEPSTLARAVARWVIERINITQMGGWADTFYQQENASLFVNDIANDLNIRSLNASLPVPPENLPALMPFVGSFDVGKPVVMLTYAAPLAAAATDFDGFDELNEQEQHALDVYLPALAGTLENLPNFSGGMMLVAMVSVGKGNVFRVTQWSDRWHVHVAPLHDWLMLAADPDCSALRLWKLSEHVERLKHYNIELLNPSGLIALWSYWRKSEFWLLPKDVDIHNPKNLLVIGTDFGIDPRLESKLACDIHSVRSHEDDRWVTVQRLNTASLFPREEQSRIYANRLAARERKLVGCVEGQAILWWMRIQEQPTATPAQLDLLYQLWECVLQWIDRSSDVIKREMPSLPQSLQVILELPDFARWRLGQKRKVGGESAVPFVEVNSGSASMTITLYEPFLAEFNQPKNIAEQNIVAALIIGAESLANTTVDDARRKELVTEIVGNEDARFFHVLETRQLEHLVGRPFRAKPSLIADEDLASAQIGLADLAGRPIQSGTLTGKGECQGFLEKTVLKLWERVEERLNLFNRQSVVTACFKAIDEINKDTEHWNATTRSLLALQPNEKDTRGVLSERRQQRSIASLANRIIIETAQYSASSDEAGQLLNRADHARLLADVDLLITMAHHRDAIAYGFLQPEIQIHARGDIEINAEFYEQVMAKYFSHRSEKQTNRAAETYDTYFNREKKKEAGVSEEEFRRFDVAFKSEYGFSVSQFVRLSDLWRQFAIESGTLAGVIAEPEMLSLLKGVGMSSTQTETFLLRFALPIRSAWDADLPSRCSKQDVFPWRFRRNLSLLLRPLVEISKQPRRWMISAPLFEKAGQYLTGNIHEGRLPDRLFESRELRSYIGEVVHRHGHEFAERVATVFRKNEYEVRTEIRLTELGAPKNPDLGDIDVLAWNKSTDEVFLTECKRLTPALTVREVIQRLEDFRGDEQRKDSLGKHIARINWLNKNRAGMEKITKIRTANIVFRPLLVTSESVPMQFFADMKFPTDQVVAFDELTSYLSKMSN